VLASRGTYLALANGTPTGFAPLKALENTAGAAPGCRCSCASSSAESRPISVQEERMIDEGIAAVMRLPREDRSLDALRTMLGMADAAESARAWKSGRRADRWGGSSTMRPTK
jgi:type IV secretion system protein VirB4